MAQKWKIRVKKALKTKVNEKLLSSVSLSFQCFIFGFLESLIIVLSSHVSDESQFWYYKSFWLKFGGKFEFLKIFYFISTKIIGISWKTLWFFIKLNNLRTIQNKNIECQMSLEVIHWPLRMTVRFHFNAHAPRNSFKKLPRSHSIDFLTVPNYSFHQNVSCLQQQRRSLIKKILQLNWKRLKISTKEKDFHLVT